MLSKSQCFAGTACLAILLMCGCGGAGDVPPLGEVTGTVTFDGKPLPGATVKFQPVDGGRQSRGMTDEQGHYVLAYSTTETGAKAGKHKVQIEYNYVMGEGPAGAMVEIPAKYNTQSELTKEVKPGEENVIDFELTST